MYEVLNTTRKEKNEKRRKTGKMEKTKRIRKIENKCKMADLNPIIWIITLNTNDLIVPIKRASEKILQVTSYLIVKDLMHSSEFICLNSCLFIKSVHKTAR